MGLDLTIVDPNIIYLGLIVGLWLGITALYVPGTGALEAVAITMLVAIFFVLTQVNTNWMAVLMLVIGVGSFLTLPFVSLRWAQYAEVGLALQAAGGYWLFYAGAVSPILIGLTIILAFLYHRKVLLPMLRANREAAALPTDDDRLIGAVGRVVKTIDPTGTVNVYSELWTARSKKTIETGKEIVVVDRNGLELIVEALKPKRDSE